MLKTEIVMFKGKLTVFFHNMVDVSDSESN
jgi:hypothetical protein